jgi:hypothetical protein
MSVRSASSDVIPGKGEDGGGGRQGEDQQEQREIENMQEFYYWFSTMADEGRVEGAERYNTHMSRMGEYQTLCGAIEGEVEGALESLASLEREYGVVASKTGALHEACEALVSQQGQLQRFADSVASKLAHFHEVERATARLSSPGFVPTDESFTALLQRLDAAVAFVREHPTFRESESHLAKLRQLLGRTLALARNHIVASLKQTATATAQATAGTPGKASAAVEDYSQLLHLKFSTLATRLRPLCHEIEARAAVAECVLHAHAPPHTQHATRNTTRSDVV